MQEWKKNPELYDAERDKAGRKKLDYYKTYVPKFLGEDPLRDWESINRCKELWNFFINHIPERRREWMVLDIGTKDGQFPQWLEKIGYSAIGIEIDDEYVKYAQKKERPVRKGDACNLDFPDESFNVVFAHHVQGLCPDYMKSYLEMFRVAKCDGYIVTCNQVPGNPRKHFSLVNSPSEVREMLKLFRHKEVYFDYWQKGTGKREDELVTIVRKKCLT